MKRSGQEARDLAQSGGLAEAFSQTMRRQMDREIEARAARGEPPADTAQSANRARWKTFVRDHPEHVPDNPWLLKGFEAARLARLALIFERDLNEALHKSGLFEEREKRRVAAFMERFAREFRVQTGLDAYPDRLVLAREYSGREYAARERALQRWSAAMRQRIAPEYRQECRELLAQAADNALSPELGGGSLEDPRRREATLAALGAAMTAAGRRAAENGLEDADIPELIADAVFSLYEKTGQCPYALLLLERIAVNGGPLLALPGMAERKARREKERLAREAQNGRVWRRQAREKARQEEETLIDLVWPFCAAGEPLTEEAMSGAGVPKRLMPLFQTMAAARYAALDAQSLAQDGQTSAQGAVFACEARALDADALEKRLNAGQHVCRFEVERAALALAEEDGRALLERYRKSAGQKARNPAAQIMPDTPGRVLSRALLDLAQRRRITGAPCPPCPCRKAAGEEADRTRNAPAPPHGAPAGMPDAMPPDAAKRSALAALLAARSRFAAFVRYEAAQIPHFSKTAAPRVHWVLGCLEDVPHEPDPVEQELARLAPDILGAPPAVMRGVFLDREQYALLCALHARVRVHGKTLAQALSELFASPAYDLERRFLPDAPPGFRGPREQAVDALIDAHRRAALDALILGRHEPCGLTPDSGDFDGVWSGCARARSQVQD